MGLEDREDDFLLFKGNHIFVGNAIKVGQFPKILHVQSG